MQAHFHQALVFLFLLIIFTPPVKMLCSPAGEWSRVEKRRLKELPEPPRSIWQVTAYFAGVEAYFADHFGYRELLIQRYHREMKKRFGIVGKETNVVLGGNGWYFHTGSEQMEDYLGHLKLSEKQLETWVAERRARAEWCRQRGIVYLLVVPPSKQSIYPEFLPAQVGPYKGTTRFEQLLAYAQADPLPFLVDLHQPLRQGKGDNELYYKPDTHWNLRGAYLGYQAILGALRGHFPRAAFATDFTVGPDEEKACEANPTLCDLAQMAMRQETITCQSLRNFRPCAHPLDVRRYAFSKLPQRQDAPSFARGCDNRELTALVFRDSFVVLLEPFLSENFKEIVYLWKPYDQQNVEEALAGGPVNVLIEEVVEQFLFRDVRK